MKMFDMIRRGLALCKFPWRDYNRRGDIFSRMHGKNGAVIRRCGDNWTVEIDRSWLEGVVRGIIGSSPAAPSASSDGGSAGGGETSETVDIVPGVGVVLATSKKGTHKTVRVGIDLEWLSNHVRNVSYAEQAEEAAMTVSDSSEKTVVTDVAWNETDHKFVKTVAKWHVGDDGTIVQMDDPEDEDIVTLVEEMP